VSELAGDEVRRFHREAIGPRGTTVIIVGDVSVEGGVAAVERALGGWRADAGGGTAGMANAATSGSGSPRTHLVAKEDAVQSEVRIGHAGPPRVHPDYFPLVIMNAILGGLFNSRINLNLREAHGYTYGAFSAFDWRRDGSVFGASSAVRSDATVSSIREVFTEIARMRDQPVSGDELSLAKQYLDGVFPIRFETTEAIASALASWTVYRLPDAYFDTYRTAIRAVTAEDVQRVARAHLDPEAMKTVVVGDPAVVRASLEEWSGGELAVYDVTGERLG
jgi:zinc protease